MMILKRDIDARLLFIKTAVYLFREKQLISSSFLFLLLFSVIENQIYIYISRLHMVNKRKSKYIYIYISKFFFSFQSDVKYLLIRINVCISPLLLYIYTYTHPNLSSILMHELYSIKTMLARFFFISMFSIYAHIILIACFAYKRTDAKKQ